jgi:hypothetical protein
MKKLSLQIVIVLCVFSGSLFGQTSRNPKPDSFSELARELALEKRIVVGVLYDTVYHGYETPKTLTPQIIQKEWESNPNVRVVLLNMNQITSYSVLFKGKMDILVYPYGGIFPMDAYGFYASDTYTKFIEKGGAILTTGSVPFSKQAGLGGNVIGKNDSVSVDTDSYEKWISKFGIKYYFSKNKPDKTFVNPDFLTAIPANINLSGCRTGVIVNNSSAEPVPKPSHGNVFPERYPTRQIIPLLSGTDKYNKVLAVNAVLVQDYQNGSRQVFFTHEEEPHPLSPSSPYFKTMMDDVLRMLVNKIMVKSVESNYACYKQGETVTINSEMVSFESKNSNVEILLQIFDGKDEVFRKSEPANLPSMNTFQKQWTWTPGKFNNDEYTMKLSVKKEGKIVSIAENGFAVWKDDVALHGPSVAIKNEYFKVGNDETFISGTNYYESTRGEVMWFRPDVKRIMDDFKQMRLSGINYIRPHYHHLKWFRDYLTYYYDSLFPFYKSLENVTNPLPDERAWRIFDLFIYLSQKYHIIYGGDLFTLVPAEMGDPRGWFGTTETIYDRDKRKVQKDFLKQLSIRYKEIKGISWDLFNEPSYIPEKDVIEWANDLRSVIKEINPKMLTTVGGADKLGSATDYDSPHGNPVENNYNKRNKPFLLQEVYVDNKENFNFELIQGEAIRDYFIYTVRGGLAGICPWSWTRQMRLHQDSYEHHYSFPMEKWDDRLGMHVHDDGTMKVAGQIFKDMSILMKSISLLDFDTTNNKVVTTQGEVIVHVDKENGQKGHSIFHVSDDQCFAALSTDSVCWKSKIMVKGEKDAYVYLICQDKKDFSKSEHLFVKSEKAGKLIINRKENPKSVSLVDISPLGNNQLEKLQYNRNSLGLELTITPTMSEYWIELNF